MAIIFGWDDRTKDSLLEPGKNENKTDPDQTNFDCTDFPRKGCRNCGRRDRPQWKGVCNDDSCCNWN